MTEFILKLLSACIFLVWAVEHTFDVKELSLDWHNADHSFWLLLFLWVLNFLEYGLVIFRIVELASMYMELL